jgi:pyroglutamyl-peptidase
MALTILITGFGPFPGAPSNPTGPLVQQLARLRRPALADMQLVPHVFRTSYEAVDDELPQLVSRLRPDAVLMFGLASRASCLKVETRARNAVSALVLDAEGRQAAALSIAPGGPDAVMFGVPAARLALAARKARIPAVTSRDAGRYLCNYLSWRAIETVARPGGPTFAAFIHVPKLGRPTRPQAPHVRRRWRMTDLLRGGEAILLAVAAETRKRGRMTK